MQRYEGRVVLVTGGASGIGRATVHRLVDEGATVVAADISEEGLAAMAKDSSRPEPVAVLRMTSYLTTLIMNYQHTGRFRGKNKQK